MLDELHVQDIALIHDATLRPPAGLTVITGETGTGKTALLTACKLVLGDRADSDAVAQDAKELSVEARFFGEKWGPDGCVVSRRVSADGRSRVKVDGALSSVSALQNEVGTTVDLCGQHEHQQLLSVAEHRRLLDSWAGDAVRSAYDAYVAAFEEAKAAREELNRVEEDGRSGQEALERARFTLLRINEVDPVPGEYEQLSTQVSLLENSEQLAQAVNQAHEALSGDAGALDSLGSAAVALDDGGRVDDRLATAAAGIREASYVIEDVARQVREYAQNMDFSDDDLARLQDRLAAFQGLLRTYGPSMEQVLEARDSAQRTVDACDNYAETQAMAQKNLDRAEDNLSACAAALSALRVKAAPGFSAAVSKQMERLELGQATLKCSVEPLSRDKWTLSGGDAVEFLFKPAANMTARPLAKIASGGEVSRVMLAIKVVLGATDSVDTLVFDEVDAGVGGSAAVALADVLADLARTHQVIVVTHLPQVAVRGACHYVVTKTTKQKTLTTSLRAVEGQDRVAEVARMLSGDDSAVALNHAEQMLKAAQKVE